jgi:hypothetical protein
MILFTLIVKNAVPNAARKHNAAIRLNAKDNSQKIHLINILK